LKITTEACYRPNSVDTAILKLRLLLKPDHQMAVYNSSHSTQIIVCSDAGILDVANGPLTIKNAKEAYLIYDTAENGVIDACNKQTVQ